MHNQKNNISIPLHILGVQQDFANFISDCCAKYSLIYKTINKCKIPTVQWKNMDCSEKKEPISTHKNTKAIADEFRPKYRIIIKNEN